MTKICLCLKRSIPLKSMITWRFLSLKKDLVGSFNQLSIDIHISIYTIGEEISMELETKDEEMSFGSIIGTIVCLLFVVQIESGLIDLKCSKSCSNGGFCLKLTEKEKCYCLPEWEGETCQIASEIPQTYGFLSKSQLKSAPRSSPCDFVPDLCQGRGMCFFNDSISKLSCVCQYPYAGARCEEISG